jgi:hypothetical protein
MTFVDPITHGKMPMQSPTEEAKGFKLLGHDRSAAWGVWQHRRSQERLRLCNERSELTVTTRKGSAHDVRDPRHPTQGV